MKKPFIFIQLFFITMISIVMNYKMPDLEKTNWDIVLFLTPFGIVSNYFNKDSSVMWSFYSDISRTQIDLSSDQIIYFFYIYLAMLMTSVIIIKSENFKK